MDTMSDALILIRVAKAKESEGYCIYSFGRNNFGQLGIGSDTIPPSATPSMYS